jgi:hypothetical protein
MSASDRVNTAFSLIDAEVQISDGAGTPDTCDLVLSSGTLTFTVEGAPYAEVKHNGKHLSTPAARKTGHGNVTGSISAKVASFKGSSDVTLYEVLTLTGGAASWTSTGNGDKKMVKIVVTINDGAVSQTITFAYCIFGNVQVNQNGEDGLVTVSADFTDLENAPTVA